MNPERLSDDVAFGLAAEKVATNYVLLLSAAREALLYLSTTDLAYEPLERALRQIDEADGGIRPPMDPDAGDGFDYVTGTWIDSAQIDGSACD